MLKRSSNLLLTALLASLFLLNGTTLTVCAQDASSKSKSQKPSVRKTTKPKASSRRPLIKITADQEREALAFAKEHHEELASLLKRLKSMDDSAYKSAIAELFRAAERINRMKERSPDRYQFDLKRWKLDSQIRLAAARSTMSGDLSHNEELTGLLQQRYDLQVEQLQAERKRLQERLKRVDDLLASKSKNADKAIAAELKRLQASLSAKFPKKKPVKKPDPEKKRSSKTSSK